MIRSMADKYRLNRYWPRLLPEAEKAIRMEEFLRSIYPVWKSIEEKDRERNLKNAAEKKPWQEDISEVETLHKQDLAIFEFCERSGKRPNRSSMSPAEERAIAKQQNVFARG